MKFQAGEMINLSVEKWMDRIMMDLLA